MLEVRKRHDQRYVSFDTWRWLRQRVPEGTHNWVIAPRYTTFMTRLDRTQSVHYWRTRAFKRNAKQHKWGWRFMRGRNSTEPVFYFDERPSVYDYLLGIQSDEQTTLLVG